MTSRFHYEDLPVFDAFEKVSDPSIFTPNLHLYMEAAQPWHLTHEGLPQFPKMPPMAPPS